MGRTIAWSKFGDLFAVVHSPDPVSQGEWEAFIEAAAQTTASTGQCRILVRTQENGGPDLMQRKLLLDVSKTGQLTVAVMSDSRVIRGVVTAIDWFGTIDIKAFAYDSLSAAAQYVSVGSEEAERLLSAAADKLVGDSHSPITADESRAMMP